MAEDVAKLRIVQKGGFAGEVELVDIERGALDEAGRRMLDEACETLAAAAAGPAGAPEIGADIPTYSLEMRSAGGEIRRLDLGAHDRIAAIVSRLSALGGGRGPA